MRLYGINALYTGGSYTPVLALIAQRIESSRCGWAFGWYIAATTLGYAVSLYLSSLMITLGGWRSAFYATAVTESVPPAIWAPPMPYGPF